MEFLFAYIIKISYLCALFIVNSYTIRHQIVIMIGLFNDNFPPVMDGVALTVQNYAYWLREQGKEVCVVTPYAPHSQEILQAAKYQLERYVSIPIPMRKPYRFGIPYLDYKFLNHLHAKQFSIIHAHCPFTAGMLARQVATKQHIPLVATFHSKYRQDFERALRYKPIVDRVVNYIVRFYEQADEVWIPQAAVEPTLREYGYKGKVVVVDNGNDFVSPPQEVEQMRTLQRARLQLNDKQTMLLFVGQHIWEKNIAFILDALALIPHLPWKLYMIGTGYAKSDIQKKINQLGLSEKVIMVGSILDREMLKRYYAAADMFLFPSLYDNAPLVVREAAAMHTPALLLQDATAAEIIRNNDNGFLCQNDPNAYAQLLAYLIAHPNEATKVGNRASQTIARSWQDVMTEVSERYDAIIDRWNRTNK